MSLFVLSDTHLALHHPGKTMEVFGPRWQHYVKKIETRWRACVGEQDTVVIAGDISWAMTLEETVKDFRFLHSLPGQKLLGKGNHDFWWNTSAKINRHFAAYGLDSLHLLHNNAYLVKPYIVCGTRGWFLDPTLQKTVGDVDYTKIVNREVLRLRLSLDAARTLQQSSEENYEIIPFFHFPPLWGDFRCREIIEVLQEYRIRRCYFGHIHGSSVANGEVVDGNIRFILTAADHLNFTPLAVI